ncbi:glioma tumor suppressor candidate region gene 2 [Plakobranchus ocellatus]|uniref:Ribosome biogenesis protein NOP53 n=1 Tax=Plakobranchus ocellatus TaxID=259542 RepID=A0AAV4CRU5_9GAST|nr:glioma tumor suppressor candidate region gene 2 [Plakobranchus ocellatus]
MADSHNAPKLSKKRKLGKNKKKSWRVSKVEDIEEFLEDERQQMRTGGLVSEKSDETLFVLDTSSSTATKKVSVGETQSKKARKGKSLRCLALLQPDPHSKAVRKPDQPNFQKGKRTSRILERLRARSQSQQRQKAAKDREQYAATRRDGVEQRKLMPVTPEDLWADDACDNKRGTSIKSPRSYKRKPSGLPATVIPHSGASVNPSYEDHQALLLEAHLVEVKKEKEQKKLHNALDAKFPDKANAPNESTYLIEMSAGLVSGSEEENEEDTADGSTSISVNPPVRREDRKTRKQRRVELESKLQANQKAKKLDVKQRENNPEGNLLQDIYKSVQRRNIIEPRVKQKVKRKYKLKTFEKKGHKAVT